MSDALSEHDVFRDEFDTNVDVIIGAVAFVGGDDGIANGLLLFICACNIFALFSLRLKI